MYIEPADDIPAGGKERYALFQSCFVLPIPTVDFIIKTKAGYPPKIKRPLCRLSLVGFERGKASHIPGGTFNRTWHPKWWQLQGVLMVK